MGLKTHNVQSFLGFRRFQFQFSQVSHANAREQCEQLKGRLAEPRTDEQFKAIQSFFSLSRLFWLGAVEQGRFVYLSDGEEIPNSSPFWGHDEPNNHSNDVFCGNVSLSFKNINKMNSSQSVKSQILTSV